MRPVRQPMPSRTPAQATAKRHAHREHEDALRRLPSKEAGGCLRPLRHPVRGGPNANKYKKTLAKERANDALRPVPHARVRRNQPPGNGKDLLKHNMQRHRRLLAHRVKQTQRSHGRMCNL